MQHAMCGRTIVPPTLLPFWPRHYQKTKYVRSFFLASVATRKLKRKSRIIDDTFHHLGSGNGGGTSHAVVGHVTAL